MAELTCGLEIHQRLSGRKLFCSCPCPTPDQALEEGSLSLRRRYGLAAGELGGVDRAAAFEAGRDRSFEYVLPPHYSCLVEADEEPPHSLNTDCLSSVLALAQACGSTVVNEVQVMRKTILDGSATTGFQRTSLIAMGGSIPISANGAIPAPSDSAASLAGSLLSSIPLQTICLEEESAGILPPISGRPAFRLDRLGVPLIEVTTEPVFHSAAEALAGAEAIGLFLRMLPGVMRGLGTIRQDVNISIPHGARVEIKGMQELRMLPVMIENEVVRQKALLGIIMELKKRGIGYGVSAKTNQTKEKTETGAKTKSASSWTNVTSLFEHSTCKVVSRSLAAGGVVLAARLAGYAGLLGRATGPNKRFGTELSDYAKVAGGVHGLIHSDEDMVKYGFSADELSRLRAALHLDNSDAFILIADHLDKAAPAMAAAIARAGRLDVPGETRKAGEDGTSSFMRPLSGAQRMYPETDVRPIRIGAELLANLPALETPAARRSRLVSLLGPELGEQMLRSSNFADFEKLIGAGESGAGGASHKPIDAKLAAVTLEQTLVSLRREGVKVENISLDSIGELLSMASLGQITKAVIPEVLKELAAEQVEMSASGSKISTIISSHSWQRLSGPALEKAWSSSGGDMRAFMAKYRLVVDGADVAALAKK